MTDSGPLLTYHETSSTAQPGLKGTVRQVEKSEEQQGPGARAPTLFPGRLTVVNNYFR